MISINNNKARLSLVCLAMTLASCGGGGGGGSKKDSTPPDRATGTISGKVYDAPVSGATVSVWEYKDGKLGRKLGESKSDQSGYYSVPVKSSSMPVYVKASGGAYRDPITEEVISASNGKTMTMSSVANFSEGTSQSIMLTPLSNMATGLAEYKIERGESATNAVTSSVNTISDMYGFDVNETTPIDITKGGQSSNATDGHKYGALLTAYSSYAKDLIDRYPTEESKTLYTSMHLSDIQYRDIRSDGVLDGKEADANGVELGMSFGQVDVNSELYTNVLSQHVMIVVNDPALNVSGTKPSEYRDFSEQLNKLGTPNGNGGALPPRDEVAIDQDAPTVTRNSDSVLAGDAKIIIDLKDDVGVKDLTVKLQLETANGWSEEMQCTDGYMEQYCKLDLTDFTSGIRATQASVEVDTFTIDRNYPTPDEGEPLILGARLVVYAEDVLGNYHESNSGVLLPFFWDNVKPVIEVESSPTINSTNDSYNLQGWAMDSTSEIASLTISLGEDDFRDITCREPAGEKCAFNEPYPATGFGAATTFTITATDAQGNETRKEWVVTKDNSPPTQSVTYPNIDDAQMAFISIAPDGSRGLTELKDYTSNTFTESNISTTQDHLKVDFVYARSGLKAVHQDIDFADFNASALTTLKNNHIPYIKVKVQDDNFDVEGGAQGTSAEDLKVTVRYYVKSPTDNDYNIAGQVSSHDAFSKPTGAIPHEEIIKNGEEPLSYLNYYVPFVQELLEDNYASVPERSEQKITITTEDRSGNLSDVSTIYFRSTFDLPTFNVVTPFANALVELRGLNSKGNFDSNPVASCTTRLVEGTTDVATCQLRSDLGAYQFLQLKLSNPGAGKAYYYQWSNKTRRDVDLSNAHLGAYFDALNPPSTIYLTELSAYHTGLFDYIWSQQSEHTYADAKAYLQQVVNALASKSNASFFGFDPVLTGYATNEDLKEILLNDEFFHRFIVEGLLDLTGGSSRISSVEYAAAFYDDLAADGKADGVNSQGQQIFVNGDKVTSDTYRQVLAMAVNNVMTSFGISVRDALEWADVIAKAYPSITVNNASQNIFTQSGGSIDGEAPSPTVTASADAGTGSVYKADNETYVAGLVKFNVQIEDASKIKNSPIPIFSALWRPLNGSDTKAFEKQLKTGTDYQRSESFDLNTKDEDSYPGIDQLTVAVEAEDVEGNNHNPPHYTVFVVDNDYPSVEYKLPAGVSNADTYLNIQGQIPLRFAVTDRVGDIPDERKVLFVSKDDPSKTKVFTKDELKNVGKDTTLELCLSCEGESKHTLDNGNWKVYFVAEDKLQNKRDQNTYGVETFTVNIDSTSPVARSEGTAEIPKVLGGNDEWPPRSLILLADDGQSPLSEISVKYKAPLSEVVDLVQCADDLSTETAPACLIAEQPDVKVRLIARNINASVDGVHQFFVVAKNAAVPAGTSSQGVLTFTPDIVGPAMMLDTPWARDTISTQGNVLGKSFDVHFTSITDASGVEAVSLYQKHTDGSEDTLVKEQVLSTQPVGSYKLNVAESEANNIDLKGSESDKVYLYVKAKDKKGFESELPSRQVRIDRNGPTLSLNVADISKNYFYTKNGYEFTLNAVDYDGSNLDNQSNDGVNKDTIRYWIYPVDQTKPDIDGTTPSGDEKRLINVLAESDVTLHVEASNTRGFSNSQSFNIRVDNNVPDIKELQASYKADSSLISDGGFVNQTGDIVFTLRAEDISGTKTPEAFYKFNGGASIPLAMQKGEDNQWSVTLGIDKTSQDGLYTFEFSVEDNVVYPGNMQSNPNTAKRTYTLNVQREGVALTKVTSPANFATYISGKSLNVEFEHSGEAQVEKLECWIRDSWNGSGNQVPDNQDPPYQLVLPSDKSYSCQLEGISGQSMKNPVLITRTFTQNKAEKVSLFSFAGLDTTVPTVVKDEADSNWVNGKYFLNEKSVLTVDGKKKFVTKLKFSDDFSGVYSEDAAGSSAGKPTLSKVSALDILLSKDKCEPLSGGGLACDFSGEVNSLLPGTNSTGEFEFVVKALEDKAGNKADPQPIVIVRPRGQIEASIESPAAGTSIEANVSASLEVKFKYKAYEGSEVTDYTVSVDGQAYVFSEDTSARFGQASDCGDGYFCNTFKYQLLSSDIDKSKLKVVVEVTDVWGLTSTPQEVSVELDGTAPVLEAVQFDPQVASSGQSVKVTAQFSEIVTSVTGSLGAEGGISNVVQWTQDDVNLMVWHGTVTAPAVGDNVTDLVLKVNEYSDVAGNKGEANSNFRLPLLPTLAVNTINDINSTNVSSVAISGTSTRFSDGDKLALHFYSQGSEITHQVGGTLEATVSNHTWQTTVDLSSVADGEVSVMAEGTNAKGAKVQSEQIQFNLSATLPNIVSNDISLDQIPVVNGQENTVTLTFSKPVKDVSAKLGEVNISFSSGEEYLKTWVGSVTPQLKAGEVSQRVVVQTGYSDLAGNTGASQEALFNVQPELFVNTITADDVILVDEAQALVLSGSALGFEQGDTLSITLSGANSETTTIEATFSSDSEWSSSPVDIADWSEGNVSVTVSGSNQNGTSANASREATMSGTQPALSNVTFNPTHQVSGESVNVSLTFNKKVSGVKATLGSADVQLTANPEGTVWNGNVVVPSVDATDAVALTVTDYQDEYGNIGSANSDYSLAYSPQMAVTVMPDQVNESDAKSVIISGTFTHVASSTMTLQLKGATQQTAAQPLNYDANAGTWASSAYDISGFTDGPITLIFGGDVTVANSITVNASELAPADKTLTLNQQKPGVSNISVDTLRDGSAAVVNVTFSESVTEGAVTIAGVNTTLTGSGSTWTATTTSEIALSATQETVNVEVSGFKNAAENTLDAHSQTVNTPVTWALTPNQDTPYSQEQAKSVVLSGQTTGLAAGTSITVVAKQAGSTLQSETAQVLSGGQWSVSLDLSASDGEVSVQASATRNAQTFESETQTLQLDTQAPSVDGIPQLTPATPLSGEAVAVKVNFTKAITSVGATTLGGQSVVWSTSGAATQWTGEVTLGDMTSAEATLILGQYLDAVGNTVAAGAEYDFAIKPTVTLDTVTITADNASNVTLTGDAFGFGDLAADQVTVSFISKDGATEPAQQTVDVTGSTGRWTLSNVDVSTLDEGNWSIEIAGQNSQGQSAEMVTQDVELSNKAPILNNVTFNPLHQDAGESVHASLAFSKKVTEVTATFGGQEAAFTANADGDIWSADLVVPSIDSTDAVTLTISSFKDAYGNLGAQSSDYSLAYSPEMAVAGLPMLVNGSESGAVTISGTFNHVVSSALTLKLTGLDKDGAAAETDALLVSYDDTAGTWTSAQYNLAEFADGSIALVFGGNVTVANGVTVNASDFAPTDKAVTLNQQKPVVTDIAVDTLSDGAQGVVTVSFSESVTEGAVTIAGVNTTLTGSGTEWTATTTSTLSLAATQETVDVEVSGFKNTVGNTLDAHSQTVNTPVTWALTPNQDAPYNLTEAKTVVISGQTTGLATDTLITVVAEQAGSTLQSETARVISDGQWSVSFDLSANDGEVSVQASADRNSESFSSAAISLELDTQVPTLTQVEFNPEHQSAGEDVAVTLTFSEVVHNVAATLGGEAVALNSNDDIVWSGTVTMPIQSGDSASLLVSGYEDSAGNLGAEDSSHTLPYTPTISVNAPGTSNSNLTVTGSTTYFEQGSALSVTLTDLRDQTETAQVTVDEFGDWNLTQDIASLDSGTIKVDVAGTNQKSVSVSATQVELTLDKDAPSVQSVVYSPESPQNGDEVTVTITFDERVSSGVTATLGGEVIDFSSVTAPATTWEGTVAVNVSAVDESLDLVLGIGYQDQVGNAGSQHDDVFKVTPTIAIKEPVEMTSSTVITGTSTGLAESTTVTITITLDSEVSNEYSGTTTIGSDGSWTSESIDMESWSVGTYTIEVKATNGQDLDAIDTLTISKSTAMLTTDNWNYPLAA